MTHKPGDYVSIDFHHQVREGFTNEDGVFDVRVIGSEVVTVCDMIKKLNGRGETIFCVDSGLVEIANISTATDDQINEFKNRKLKSIAMLEAGELLLNSIKEPEYI